jgi:hypothetical protein
MWKTTLTFLPQRYIKKSYGMEKLYYTACPKSSIHGWTAWKHQIFLWVPSSPHSQYLILFLGWHAGPLHCSHSSVLILPHFQASFWISPWWKWVINSLHPQGSLHPCSKILFLEVVWTFLHSTKVPSSPSDVVLLVSQAMASPLPLCYIP